MSKKKEPARKFLISFMFQADYTTYGNCLIESQGLPLAAVVRETILASNINMPATGRILILGVSEVHADAVGKDFAFVNKTGEVVMPAKGVKLLQPGK